MIIQKIYILTLFKVGVNSSMEVHLQLQIYYKNKWNNNNRPQRRNNPENLALSANTVTYHFLPIFSPRMIGN